MYLGLFNYIRVFLGYGFFILMGMDFDMVVWGIGFFIVFSIFWVWYYNFVVFFIFIWFNIWLLFFNLFLFRRIILMRVNFFYVIWCCLGSVYSVFSFGNVSIYWGCLVFIFFWFIDCEFIFVFGGRLYCVLFFGFDFWEWVFFKDFDIFINSCVIWVNWDFIVLICVCNLDIFWFFWVDFLVLGLVIIIGFFCFVLILFCFFLVVLNIFVFFIVLFLFIFLVRDIFIFFIIVLFLIVWVWGVL